MFSDIAKSFDQLFSGAFWAVTAKTLLLTVPLLVVTVWAGIGFVQMIPTTGWHWLDWILNFLSSAGVFIFVLVLFPALAQMVMGIFLDDIAEAVEKKHYPADPPGRPVGTMTAAKQGLRLGLIVLVVNIVLLPLYLVFMFFPVLSLVLYYVVNGWLFNREYFELVATRHVDEAQYRALRRRKPGMLFLAGCAIAFVFSVPVVNLVAPAWATAYMLHVYKRVEKSSVASVA